MLVGSFASSAYGEPRFTQDIDIVLDLPAAQIPALCAAFPVPDFYVSESAVREAVQRRFQFNVLHTTSRDKIDFLLPRDGQWGPTPIGRRQPAGHRPGPEGFA